MRRRAALAGIGAVALGAAAGCVGRGGSGDPTPAAFSVRGPAFEGDRLPARFTCDGAGVSPPLRIERAPPPTAGFAVVATVPISTAEQAPLWLLWDLPPERREIPAGVPAEPVVSSLGGARQGRNASGAIGYLPPCPPRGVAEEVWFTVYALREPLGLAPGATRDAVSEALESAQLAGRRLVVGYRRPAATAAEPDDG